MILLNAIPPVLDLLTFFLLTVEVSPETYVYVTGRLQVQVVTRPPPPIFDEHNVPPTSLSPQWRILVLPMLTTSQRCASLFEVAYLYVICWPQIRNELKAGFRAGKLRSIAFRKDQLLGLAYLIKDNEKMWQEALHADLGRPALETNL
jgi:hypothetical protein